MAKLIPSTLPPGTAYSEKKVISKIAQDPLAESWTILHSVGLKKTRIGPYGEIDAIIFIPGSGILCVEVKGGIIKCKDGVWSTQNRRTNKINKLKKSPFLQARENMFSFIGEIKMHFGIDSAETKCPVSYLVIFPDVEFSQKLTEAESWELLDEPSLRSSPAKACLRNLHYNMTSKRSISVRPEYCSQQLLRKIFNFVRPNFETVLARSTVIRESEDKLLELTEEQYDFLDTAELNKRTLVEGAAGTGKSLLAIEFARREAHKGKKVLLLCYNKLLGGWLKNQVRGNDDVSITAGSYHYFLRQMIHVSPFKEEFEKKLKTTSVERRFQDIFPFYAELALAEAGYNYDAIIIDEAQDLFSSENLSVFNALVKGGLTNGEWVIFGDFTRQAIYARNSADNYHNPRDYLNSEGVQYANLSLRTNCRNTRKIAEETALLSGFDSMPFRAKTDGGLSVVYSYWARSNEQVNKLKVMLEKLLSDGIPPDDIVLLSTRKIENSVLNQLTDFLNIRFSPITDYGIQDKNTIFYSTVHAFKGLESPVIILTDVQAIETDYDRSVIYIGMSRAKSCLLLLAHENLKDSISQAVMKKLAGFGS